MTANAVNRHWRDVWRVYLLNRKLTTETLRQKTTMTRALRTSMRPTATWTTTRATCTWPEHALRARNLCHTLFILSHMHLMAQVWVSSLAIHVHVRFSMSSPLYSSLSTCPSLSSFPSLSCTSSNTLSSTTWSPCKTCAPPRTRGVTTLTTSPSPSQDQGDLLMSILKKWQSPKKFVMRSDAAEFVNKWSSAKKTEKNARCRVRWKAFNNMVNVMAATMNAATFMGKTFQDNQKFHHEYNRSHLEENLWHVCKIGGRTRWDLQCG